MVVKVGFIENFFDLETCAVEDFICMLYFISFHERFSLLEMNFVEMNYNFMKHMNDPQTLRNS